MKKTLLTLGAALLLQCSLQAATTLNVSLTADGSSRWYEYISDVYAQIDKEPDGFYLISTDNAVGGGVDVFPHEGNWANVGSFTLSGTVTGVGVETFSITSSTFNFAPYIAEDDAVIGVSYTTTMGAPTTGTIQFTNGVVSSIDYNSPITFRFIGFETIPFAGQLVINNSGFDLDADGTAPYRWRWDATGTAAFAYAVPEPSRFLLVAAGVGGVLLQRRRRYPIFG